MPPPPDYYSILGVAEDADQKEIKAAYRRLAREHHPDRNAGDKQAEEQFKRVQEAYDTLGTADKRKQYDRARRNPFGAGPGFGGFQPGGGRGPGGAAPGGGRFYRTPDGTYVRVEAEGMGPDEGFTFSDDGGGFGDLFGRFFGGGGFGGSRPAEPPRGADVETRLDLSFEKALRGGKSEITLPDGEKVRITIPEGAEDGQRIRLRGRGRTGPTGERGDLYITFSVLASPRFQRDGLELATKLRINVVEAMLGTTRVIENAYGDQVKVPIPEGTQPGDRLRLRGQGIRTEKGTGSLVVEVEVEVPRKLSDEAKTGVRIWAEGEGLL